MFGFIKKIFGGQAAPAANPDPFGRDKVLPAAVAAEPVPRAAAAAVLQRDEIIDERTRIAGYRLSARRPDAPGQPDPEATLALLAGANVAALAERRIALIPVSAADWMAHDYRPLIGPNTVFQLQPPGSEAEVAPWRDVADAMHAAGARIALPDSVMTTSAPLADVADFALVDFSGYSLASFEQAVARLRATRPALQVIVEQVARWPEQRYCVAHGAAFCNGPFATAPDEEQAAGEISQSRLVLIEMLNQLRRDVDLAEIAEVAKRDPGVVVKVVAMANSPLLGRSQRVTGIDQAIMVLGCEQLYRWLSIGMFRAGDGTPRDEILLELALARGRFLEVLGREQHDKRACDELFLLGLLSLLDCLLGVPMATVLERIHLSPEMKEVLLSSGGPFGRYLLLAIAVEKGHAENVARLAGQLGYSLASIEAASLDAIGWAEEAATLSG
ncbi:MAG TPA: HDOD domain-containing protein [Azonexus sp.]